MTPFVSLHNQTHYSILDSLISPKELFLKAKELGQSAVAITDHGSLAATWEAFKLSREIGVKLIIGCECYFQNSVPSDDKFRHIVLLAKNQIGYKNLLTLNKKGFDQGPIVGKKVYPVIDWKLLEEHSEGLICLTACGNGIISQLLTNGKFDEAERTLLKLKGIFNSNLGIEILPNNMERGSNLHSDKIDQRFLNRRLIELGKKHNIKVVAACNAHYIKKDDHGMHDVLLAIGGHQPIYSNFRLRYPTPEFYLKSGDEVKQFFTRNFGEEFATQVCENSVYFADLCETPEWIDPKFSNPSGKELPIFPVKDEPNYLEFLEWVKGQPADIQKLEEDKLYLRYTCEITFDDRVKNLSSEQRQQYQARIAEELDVLEYHGFSSYMLIVADFINWARKNDIAVGEGRGSVGGSLVAYLLNIHQADPIKYNLIFARFHNKEKSSFPDIDTDFAPSGRELVQNYLRKKYGDDHVAHVSNVNTITPKVYVRDIARACELGGSKEEAVKIGNDAADCIPKDIHSIDEALEKVPLFVEYCKRYPEFVKYKSICGKYRAWSTHAGGIIISARPLTGLVPLRKDKDGAIALEYDKEKAEENGLIKMDTLGLSTLDIIGQAFQLIKEINGQVPDQLNFEEYNELTYNLISKGDTFGVFQLGTSGGTIDLCRRIKPKSINDISYINSLARPSARDMRDDFISTKDGKKKFALLHPNLGRAFNNTYGFGLYEESLMYLAQDIAGWTLHSADRLRKLTKEKGKNPKKAQQWRMEFINDAVKNNIPEEIAKKIWDEVIDLFQGYGFNMSHSIMYSMLSYKTAWLKANYPIEFLLANLMAEVKSNAPDAKSNIDKIKNELREHNVNILPPDINKSQLSYTIKGKELLTGLDALKFVGDDAILDIIEKRPFKSFFDFMVRVDSRKVRSNAIQALSIVGSMDSFGIPRKLIYLYCSDYRKKLQVWLKKHDPNKDEFVYPWPNEGEWKLSEIFAMENAIMGEAFICKPAQAYGNFFKDDHKTITHVRQVKDKTKLVPIKAIVKDVFELKVKKEGSKFLGQTMVKALIEDAQGEQCSLTIFPDRWQNIQKRLKDIHSKAEFTEGLAICFAGTTNNYDDNIGIIMEDLYNLALPPAPPEDRKAKKVSLKTLKSDLLNDKNEKDQAVNWATQIEDDLYNEGLIDLDAEEENDS